MLDACAAAVAVAVAEPGGGARGQEGRATALIIVAPKVKVGVAASCWLLGRPVAVEKFAVPAWKQVEGCGGLNRGGGKVDRQGKWEKAPLATFALPCLDRPTAS